MLSQNMEGNNGHIKLDIGVGQPKSNGDIPLVGKYGCLLLSQKQKMGVYFAQFVGSAWGPA